MKQVLRAQIQQKLMPSSQLDIRTNNTIKKKKTKTTLSIPLKTYQTIKKTTMATIVTLYIG